MAKKVVVAKATTRKSGVGKAVKPGAAANAGGRPGKSKSKRSG